MGGGAGASEGREEEEMNHWILLLSSVPLDSAMFILPIDRPTLLTTSRRGGMRSFMRSRPFASSKLAILCCGEKPRMATREKEREKNSSHQLRMGKISTTQADITQMITYC